MIGGVELLQLSGIVLVVIFVSHICSEGEDDLSVACHAKRKKLTRKTKKTLLNTTFKSVFYYL